MSLPVEIVPTGIESPPVVIVKLPDKTVAPALKVEELLTVSEFSALVPIVVFPLTVKVSVVIEVCTRGVEETRAAPCTVPLIVIMSLAVVPRVIFPQAVNAFTTVKLARVAGPVEIRLEDVIGPVLTPAIVATPETFSVPKTRIGRLTMHSVTLESPVGLSTGTSSVYGSNIHTPCVESIEAIKRIKTDRVSAHFTRKNIKHFIVIYPVKELELLLAF